MNSDLWILLILLIVIIAIILFTSNKIIGGVPENILSQRLLAAANSLQPKAFYELLKQGANINARDGRGRNVVTIVSQRITRASSTSDLINAKLLLTIIDTYLQNPKLLGAPGATGAPIGTPGTPTGTPGTPIGTPGTPTGTPGTPTGTPGTPTGTPGTPMGLAHTQFQDITSNPNYAEPQESAACGRHSLNNLFGGRFFIKDSGRDVSVQPAQLRKDSFGVPISLQSLCRYLNQQMLRATSGIEGIACPPDENYDINVLRAALNILGFESEQCTKQTLQGCLRKPNVVGFIANYGAGHWVSIQMLGNGKLKYINSVGEPGKPHATSGATVLGYGTLDQYMREYGGRIVQILVVRTTSEDFINPMRHIEAMARAAVGEERTQVTGQQAKTQLRIVLQPVIDTIRTYGLGDYANHLEGLIYYSIADDLERFNRMKDQKGYNAIITCLLTDEDIVRSKRSMERVMDYLESCLV